MGKYFCWLIWLLLVVGAVYWGLDAMGKNIFLMAPFVSMPKLAMWVKYIIGAAGVISIVMVLFGKCCHSCKPCKSSK